MTYEPFSKSAIGHRQLKIKFKEQGECYICGCTDVRLLEFDHLFDKESIIVHTFNSKKIVEEMKKCVLICVWCHRLKSYIEKDFETQSNGYSIEEDIEKIDPDNSKKCTGVYCEGKIRNKKYFYNRKNGKIRDTYCKKCMNYKKAECRNKNREYITNQKLLLKECNICKTSVTKENYICFDFDHLQDKKLEISALSIMFQSNSTELIQKEIEKCQLLCCCCHRIKTQIDFNHNKTMKQVKELIPPTKIVYSKKYITDLVEKITTEKYREYILQNIFDEVKKELLSKVIKIKPLVFNIKIPFGTIAQCTICNKYLSPQTRKALGDIIQCSTCYRYRTRKVKERPSLEQLLDEVSKHSYIYLGEKYGVSDNVIRAWIRMYGAVPPKKNLKKIEK